MSRYSAPFANAAIRYIAEIWLSAAEYSDLLIGGSPIQIVGLRAMRSWAAKVLMRCW